MALNNEDFTDDSIDITPSNGVPRYRKFADTADVAQAVEHAVASEENTVQALAKLILASNSHEGGGNGGDGGAVADKVLKDIKKHKWLAGVMALILGPGGMTATYYAVKDRSLKNESAVKNVQLDIVKAHVREVQNIKEITLIKGEIGKINSSIVQAGKMHTVMLDGIKSLQEVNVNRLEKENVKLEQELRRERNRNR